jgi:hypothetical protein
MVLEGELIDAIYNTLKKDVEFMAHFGLSPTSTPDKITSRIVRGMEPEKTFTGASVPQVLIYQKPGRFGRNYLVYEGKFSLDFYAKSTSDARKIAKRAFKLFHDQYVQGTDFSSYRASLAYDDDFATGITGVKGHGTIYDVDYIRTN